MNSVKVKVLFIYEGIDNEKYVASISVSLPANQAGHLHSLFGDANINFFDNYLNYYWGNLDEDKKTRTAKVRITSGEGWEDLVNKVEQYIQTQIEILRGVVKRNLEAINTKPQDFEREYVI